MAEVKFSDTPQGKAQSKRMLECRVSLGCSSAKEFYDKFSNNRFSYPQYQKYESGERLLGQKAAMMYAEIFNVDWEWLKNGLGDNKNISQQNILNSNTQVNISEKLILKILTRIELWEDENDCELSSQDKAQLIKLIYLKLQKTPEEEQDREASNIIDIYDFMKKAT